MKKYIVTTTINAPTEALIAFSKMGDWTLVVVGDKKTPHHKYSDLNCVYLSPEWQKNTYKELSELIGWNCVQRRNIGFIYAVHNNADIIATVDDDNIPYAEWGNNILIGQNYERKSYITNKLFDPLSATNYSNLWHRGFPIQLLDEKNSLTESKTNEKILVQADCWDGDPDIDAIPRITLHPECKFDHDFFFSSPQISPFNSQNTFLSPAIMMNYFCFPFIQRMDDIWASFFLQTVISPESVAYGPATVYQKRNPHDLSMDLLGEVIGYEKSLKWINKGCELDNNYLPQRSIDCFEAYKFEFKK